MHRYFVGAYVFEITKWVVEATLHDAEVLVQFVHDVRAVTVQLARVRLLPRRAFHRQRRAQLFRLQLERADPQRPFQLTDFFLQTLCTQQRYTTARQSSDLTKHNLLSAGHVHLYKGGPGINLTCLQARPCLVAQIPCSSI